jgi:membrane-associated phospholipid phosphatase
MPLLNSTDATLAHGGGANVSAWLLVLLALLVTEAGVLTWALQHVKQSRTTVAPGAPDVAMGKYLLGGTIVAAASAAFMAIAFEVGAGGSFVRIERVFSTALHDMASARTQQIFGGLTHLGDGLTLALLCAAAAAIWLTRREHVLALGLVAAIGGNGLLNAVLKRVFERMRPPHEPGLPYFHGWGFPSGHASGSVVAYGIVAYVLMRALPKAWHPPVMLLAAAAAMLVGASRIILEAHYAGDVLAGFASGTAWLFASILGLEMIRDVLPAAI